MADSIKAACVQMTAGPDIEENLKQAEDFIREAADKGARFISTPENTDFIRGSLRKSLETSHAGRRASGRSVFFLIWQKSLVFI